MTVGSIPKTFNESHRIRNRPHLAIIISLYLDYCNKHTENINWLWFVHASRNPVIISISVETVIIIIFCEAYPNDHVDNKVIIMYSHL